MIMRLVGYLPSQIQCAFTFYSSEALCIGAISWWGKIIESDDDDVGNFFIANISFMFLCFVIFQPVHNADFIVPVEIDGTIHQVQYVVI